MRPIVLLACAAAFVPAQESPKITIDRSDPFPVLAREVAKQAGEKLACESVDGEKPVKLRVRDAGFYEALDALCRAHGGMTYLTDTISFDDETLHVGAGTWVDYPASYSGPFKVAILGAARFTMRSEIAGDHSWVRVHVALFTPYRIRFDRWGHQAEWTCREAVDASGADLLLPDKQRPNEAVTLASESRLWGPSQHGLWLRDFDLAKGLKKLSGTVTTQVGASVELRLPAEPGGKVETPNGTLTLKSVDEFEKQERGSTWRVVLEYSARDRANPKMEEFDDTVKIDDQTTFRTSTVLEEGKPFELKTWGERARPKVIQIRVRTGSRKVEIPFEFKNVAWKADK